MGALSRSVSWYRGAVSWAQRAVTSGIASLRTQPARPGSTSGRVASSPTAERDLQAMTTSPGAFAALTRSALSFTTYPIRAYYGYSVGGTRPRPLDPEDPSSAWVGRLLRLLQTPDPASAGALFPRPGEGMIAQIVADLKACGVFVIVPTLQAGEIVGLTRLHPGCCSIERTYMGEELVYRNGSEYRRYPRDSVCIAPLLSWARGGQSELGTGAGAALYHLIAAEAAALEQTATTIRQGGADVLLTGANETGEAMLSNEKVRKDLVKSVTEQLAGVGRRVMALGGHVKMVDAGLKPADLRAPEMLKAALSAILMALGVVPVAIGAGEGTYATAVQQYRVQAEMDQGIAVVIEAYLLRPLARHFAQRAGGIWAQRLDMVTAAIDLSSHPGNTYLQTDALKRMESIMRMGWTNEQAADHQNIDLPKPLGVVALNGSPVDPGPEPGSHKDPREPVGSGTDLQSGGPPTRTVLQLLRGQNAA